MENINLNEYKVKEIVREENGEFNDMIKHLLEILNDRTIPEENKQLVRKQFDEVMRLKMISMKPPTIILTKK